jgi:hypothetical protein
MIRPFTCIAFLLACGSGLYLYQSKHRASLLDARIAQTVKSTDALREQTRMLSAEWTLLNDPERLRQLATQFLTLQTVSPTQFTSLADLDSRLPAPVPPGGPASGEDTLPSALAGVPVASNASGRTGADEGKAADPRLADASPKPVAPAQAAASLPSARTVVAASVEPPRSVEARPANVRVAAVVTQARSIASLPRSPEPRGPEPRGFEPRVTEARLLVPPPRAAAPTALPRPNFQASGSLLGMAHDVAAPPAPMPLPRPMPVNAPQWSYGGSGG